MSTIALYLGIMAACYLIGARFVKDKEKLKSVGIFTTASIYLLIFTMGIRIGANEEVISNLASIGLQALITIIAALSGSMIVGFLVRKAAGLNRYGLKESEGDESAQKADKNGSGIKSSLITLADALSGMIAGYLLVPVIFSDVQVFQDMAGTLIDVLLCILLGSIGLDLGLDGNIFSLVKSIGFKIILLPVSIITGTFLAGAIYGILGPLSMKESIAVFGGMGWYSFAPVLIINAGYIEASAVAFLHNIFREILSLLLIPVVSEKIGYFEAACMPGSPGMDICLPAVERSTNSEMVIYSLFSGIIISIMIPVWIPLILGA